MDKIKYSVGSIVVTLGLMFVSCAQRFTLDVMVDDEQYRVLSQPVKFFLINETNATAIEQIRTSNSTAIRSALAQAQDSLRLLYRDYLFNEALYWRTKSEIEQQKAKLTVDYHHNLIIELIQINKIDCVWNFWVKITNVGRETIEGVYLGLVFNNKNIVSGYYPVDLKPHQSAIIDDIFLDVSQNNSLAYQLSSHPGGLSGLTEAIAGRIDSVKSDFDVLTSESERKLGILKQTTEDIGLLIDEFPAMKSNEIQIFKANPVNQIIENNLNRFGAPMTGLANGDTVHFRDLKPGKYALIAYISPHDSIQWHLTYDLKDYQLIKCTSHNLKPFFFLITEDMLSYRPFQDISIPEIK